MTSAPSEPPPGSAGYVVTDQGVWRRHVYGWRLLDTTTIRQWEHVTAQPGFALLAPVPPDHPDTPVVDLLRQRAALITADRSHLSVEDQARADALHEAARLIEIRHADGPVAARDVAVQSALTAAGELLGPLLTSVWDGGRAVGYTRGRAATHTGGTP